MKLKVAGVGLMLAVAGTATALALAAGITPITVAPKDSAGAFTIDGIEGGDTVGADPISVLSFSWGVTKTDANTGAPDFHELTVTKLIDKASPNLWFSCATGRHFQRLILVLNRPGAPAGTPFVQYLLRDVVVTSVSHSGSGNDRPTEKVSFQYVRIEQTYTTADGATVFTSFDRGA